MSAEVFLDTNILVYAFAADDVRSARAVDLLRRGGIVSVQVLSEFVNVSRSKLHRDWQDIREEMALLKLLLPHPVPVTEDTHRMAIDIAESTGYHFYDSQIVAAALLANCKTLYSEDLHNGFRFHELVIENPFT